MKISKSEKQKIDYTLLVTTKASLARIPWDQARSCLARLLSNETVRPLLAFYYARTRKGLRRVRRKQIVYTRQNWARQRNNNETEEFSFCKEMGETPQPGLKSDSGIPEQKKRNSVDSRATRAVSQGRTNYLQFKLIKKLLKGILPRMCAPTNATENCFGVDPVNFIIALVETRIDRKYFFPKCIQVLTKHFLNDAAKGARRKIGLGLTKQKSDITDLLTFRTPEQCIFNFLLKESEMRDQAA